MSRVMYKKRIDALLSESERAVYAALNTPYNIQVFINSLEMRTDVNEPIVRSPREVLQKHKASCIEGALLACAILEYHGLQSYLLDLKVDPDNETDSDHVVAVFTHGKYFGAISKTSHAVLRYREPIYTSIRELVMSYFHEYFLDTGEKTLRSFSKEYPIFKKFGVDWITSEEDLYEIACALDAYPHRQILSKTMIRDLRPADSIEISAGKLKE